MPEASLPYVVRTGDQRAASKVQGNDEALRDAINSIDDDKIAAAGLSSAALSDALAALLGLTKGTTVRRGKSIISTEESRTNTGFGLMPTPDRVQGVTLPTDGLLFIYFQAMWKESVQNAAAAAVFIGSNQLKNNANTIAAPAVQQTALNTTANTYKPLVSMGSGLAGAGNSTAYTGDVTTGQALGMEASGTVLSGPLVVKAAAGSYDISVQYLASSGSVTVKNRSLWVVAEGF